ncbi:uncharacterized protein LOC135129955 [Zophobas morio]|uniref:uncharacterized protein LOC135129955 n=1 Tax=Zophobas morio TaxID=2755281 RepID=UPI003083174F
MESATTEVIEKMIDSVTKMMQLCNNNVQKLEKVLKLNRKNLRIVNGVLRNSDCVGEKRRLENYLARIKGLNLHIESKIENEKIGYGNSKKRRNSKVRWIEVKSAFVGRVRTGAVVNLDENLVDIRRFFHDASPLIFSRITNILKKMTAIKLNFEMSCEYIIPSTGEVSLKYFNTPNTMILLSTDIQKSIDDLAGIIQTKMEEFAESKSGWSLRKICQLMVAFNKYTPINGRIYIPLPTELKKKGGIINIMNTDRLCFVWSVLASLYPCKDSNYERTDAYPQNYHDILNLRGVQMPVQLSSIPKFEAQNSNISINVFTVNDKTHEIEGPIYHTKNVKNHHINLLYLKKTRSKHGHYCLISDLSKVCGRNISAHKAKMFICDRCLNHFSLKSHYESHQQDCKLFSPVKITLPDESSAHLEFSNYKALLKKGFVIYADFECLLIKGNDHPMKYRHIPYSVAFTSVCSFDNSLNTFFSYIASSPNDQTPASWFIAKLQKEINKMTQILRSRDLPMLPLSDEEKLKYNSSMECPICGRVYCETNPKVHHHDHLTGKYIAPYCQNCNLQFKKDYSIPVFLHNLSGYDAHLFIEELARSNYVNLVPLNMEKYIGFSTYFNQTRVTFLDSYRFLSSSLDSLVKNLTPDQLLITKSYFSNVKNFPLLTRKQVFCYEYLDCWDKLSKTKLPEKHYFYSSLHDEHISDEDYAHAKLIWDEFSIKNLSDYALFYLKLDVLLLADCFENFRNLTMKYYGLDAAGFFTAPGLSWAAALKMTQIKLRLFTDIDMTLFIEKALRGGISQSICRYSKANNKYCSSYDPNLDTKYLIYWDVCNLYGWAQCQSLPYDHFRWLDNFEIESLDINTCYANTADKCCILEVDLEYSQSLHDLHEQLPFCCEHQMPPNSQNNSEKLLCTLCDKTKYVIHLENLRQTVHFGLKVIKIHRVLEFSQKPWLKPYIMFNTDLRMQAKSAFEKDFFKLMINANYGKTLENDRKKRKIKLANNWFTARKYISLPEFKCSQIINEDLVVVELNKTTINFEKPIYVGFTILELSKTLMYDFHYNFVKKDLSNWFASKLLYMDTDSFIYEFTTLRKEDTTDIYHIIRDYASLLFDTSDLPVDNQWGIPQVNKKEKADSAAPPPLEGPCDSRDAEVTVSTRSDDVRFPHKDEEKKLFFINLKIERRAIQRWRHLPSCARTTHTSPLQQ